MKYILKSTKEIIITYILSYLLIFLIAIPLYLLDIKNISTLTIILILPYYILISIYLYNKNKIKEQSLPLNHYLPLISIGLSISVFLNMLIYIFSPPLTIITPTPLTFLSSSIIGPIYEEILFRYLLYNRLNQKYTKNKSLFITTLIFALSHLSPLKIAYAFILGLLLNKVYQKESNLIAPILIHISANAMSLFLYEYNTYLLLLSFINLILNLYIILRNKRVK